MNQSKLQQNVEVPFEKLAPETLRNLVEEYFERDGTYHGVTPEMTMDQKVDMVI